MRNRLEDDYSPGLGDDFIKALNSFEASKNSIQLARLAELERLIDYLISNLKEAGVKNYAITDPAYNIKQILEEYRRLSPYRIVD